MHKYTHAHTHRIVLAVVLVHVHQQHALAIVEAVVVERAVAALC